MELINVNDNGILIILTQNDKNRYRLNGSVQSEELNKAYTDILLDMGVEDSFLQGVLVEIFVSQNGGCEMFITKMPDSYQNPKDNNHDNEKTIYIFTNVSDLLSACKRLYDINPKRDSTLYYNNEKKVYYLVCSAEQAYLCEFMAKRCNTVSLENINEHFALICENAENTLSNLV